MPGPGAQSQASARYTRVALGLHWLTAGAIIALLALGLFMTDLPRSESSLKFELYQLHKSLGISVLLLSVLRLVWRLTHPAPPLPGGLRPWERIAARTTHIGFYVLLLAIPLAGWAMTSASPYNIPTVLYQLIPWPHLPWLGGLENKAEVEVVLKSIHETLALLLATLLLLHIAAALKHHFVLRDQVLERMLPLLSRRKR